MGLAAPGQAGGQSRSEGSRAARGRRAKVALALVLAAVAGFVDVCAYVSFGVYAANMTGNLISLAIGITGQGGGSVWERALVIAFFFGGTLAGALLVGEATRQAKSRPHVSWLLPVEAALLAVVAVLSWWREVPLGPVPLGLALLAVAAGMQNATLHRIGPVTFRTTHMTGRLTRTAEVVVELGGWMLRHGRGRSARRRRAVLRLAPRQRPAREAALVGGIFLSFLAGACAGALGLSAWGRTSLLVPAAVVAAAALVTAARPELG